MKDKKCLALKWLSEISFAMFPFAIDSKNSIFMVIVCILTISPLILLAIAAISIAKRTRVSYFKTLFDTKPSVIDIIISCVGILNCFIVDLIPLSIIWLINIFTNIIYLNKPNSNVTN